MSEVTIRAEHGGLTADVTVSTRSTNQDDYRVCLDAALRAVAAALTPLTDGAALFDQDDQKTQPIVYDPDTDYEATPTERARAQRP